LQTQRNTYLGGLKKKTGPLFLNPNDVIDTRGDEGMMMSLKGIGGASFSFFFLISPWTPLLDCVVFLLHFYYKTCLPASF